MPSQNLALRLLGLLGALLLIKVSIAIVGNYSLYFPPNFEQGFLDGRAQTFVGLYRLAFYGHIVVGPICMAIGTVQLTPWSRRTAKLHRWLGRLQLLLILLVLSPSGTIMAWHSYAGWIAGFGFLSLAIATTWCALQGWRTALVRRYDDHARWMLRCSILLCSAILLRIIGGATEFMHWDAEASYRVAAWSSWVVPLLVFELIERHWHLCRHAK
jgi:hypothetical protein